MILLAQAGHFYTTKDEPQLNKPHQETRNTKTKPLPLQMQK